MAAAFVKATTGAAPYITGSTLVTSAFSGSTTAGNAILVAVFYDYSAIGDEPLSSVSDSKGNTYTLIGSEFTDANSQSVRFAYSLGISNAGASHTVTGNFSGGDSIYVRIIAHEVSGLLTSLALDKDSGGSQATGTSLSDTAVVPDSDGQYIFSAIMADGGTASETFVAAGGVFTEAANGTAAAADNEVQTEYYVQPTAASVQAQWTRSGTGGHCVMRTATFRAAGPAASTDHIMNTRFIYIED